MQITSFGHSCLLVEIADTRLLFDPGAFSPGFEQLRDLAAVVVTHEHPDHLDVDRLATLLRANPDAALLAEPAVADDLSGQGHDAAALAAGGSSRVGSVTLSAVGGTHAMIHADIPMIGNVGVLVAAEGEPTLLHPGDSYDATPPGVDLLAVPLSAPWAALKETVEFARAVAAPVMFPIHDAIVSETGRGLYTMLLDNLTGEAMTLRDIRDQGAVAF